MPFVLLRARGEEPTFDSTVLVGVFQTEEEVKARLQKIANANPQYKLRELSSNRWIIGPEEDEGFFGDHPVHIMCLHK